MGVALGLLSVGKEIRDVGDVVDSKIDSPPLDESTVNCASIPDASTPEPIGTREEPEIAVVVDVNTLPGSTSGIPDDAEKAEIARHRARVTINAIPPRVVSLCKCSCS